MKEQYPISLKRLPYSYDALEPYISQKTMTIHHTRLLARYIRDLNELISKNPEYKGMSLTEIYSRAGTKNDETASKMQFLSAAVYNHNLFFAILAPSDDYSIRTPVGDLSSAIKAEYGSVERFMIAFRDTALALRGSGWIFMCKDPEQKPKIITCKNHSLPDTDKYRPILILDCWEHAFFLDYLDRKNDYYENYFRLINWKLCELFWKSSVVYK